MSGTEHMSGAEIGAERAENGVSASDAVSGYFAPAHSICYPRESEGLWNHRRWFVCLFACLLPR